MNDRCILLTCHSGNVATVTAYGRLLLPATTGRTRPWQATTPSSPTSCWPSSWIPEARPLAGALPAWRLIRVLCEPTSSRTVLTWTAQKGGDSGGFLSCFSQPPKAPCPPCTPRLRHRPWPAVTTGPEDSAVCGVCPAQRRFPPTRRTRKQLRACGALWNDWLG